VGIAERQFQIVEYGDDRPATCRKFVDSLQKFILMMDIEMGGGLVKEQNIGLLDHRLGKERALALTPTQLQDRTTREALEVYLRQGPLHPVVIAMMPGLEEALVGGPAEEHKVTHAQVERERGGLSNESERSGQIACPPGPDGPPAKIKPAVIGQQTGQGPQQRRLSAAVRPEKPYPFAGRDREAHTAQDFRAPESDAQVVPDYERCTIRICRSFHSRRYVRTSPHPKRLIFCGVHACMKSLASRAAGALALLMMALPLSGCSSRDLQAEFVEDAMRAPSSFTRTNQDGEILEDDPDDWRTSPLHRGLVLVRPVFPNPSAGEQVTLEFQILHRDAVASPVRLTTVDALGFYQEIPQTRVINVRDPGHYVMRFHPAAFGAPGLYRLYLFDGRQDLISYGDFCYEPC
jgi:hypothetical protein